MDSPFLEKWQCLKECFFCCCCCCSEQLILLQSDGIHPTMALAIKASPYLWSKSTALLLAEHAIVFQILSKTKTLNLYTLLSFSYPRHFAGEVYSQYTETHTWCSLWFRTQSLSCQARHFILLCSFTVFLFSHSESNATVPLFAAWEDKNAMTPRFSMLSVCTTSIHPQGILTLTEELY